MRKALVLAATIAIAASAASAGEQLGAHFMEVWDHDGDGQITLQEASEQRDNLFASFDGNDDGVLTADEYAEFKGAREGDAKEYGGNAQGGPGKSGAKLALQGMTMQFNDVDGNGEVSAEEMSGRSGDWLARIDRNDDGVLTVEEFGPLPE